MPSSDLILNVKQIAGYAASDPVPSDVVVVQRGGLGGPYLSMAVEDLVGEALVLSSVPFQTNNSAPANAVGGQVFTNVLSTPLDASWLWNAYAGADGFHQLSSGQPSALIRGDLTGGFQFYWGAGGGAGTLINFGGPQFSVSPNGYLTVADQVLLGRDPSTSFEAATLQWTNGQIMASLKPLYGYYQTATVWSFNNRTGQVILNLCDVMGAGGAPISSPQFQGIPTAPSPSTTDNSNQIATTQWVWQAIGGSGPDLSGYAPLASPAFSGLPTAPTAPTGTATGQIATTAFVAAALSASVSGVSSFNTRTGAVSLITADITGAGGAVLASPAFSGVPTAPTAAVGTNTGQLATCAFVLASNVTSFNTRQGAVTFTAGDLTVVGGATQAYVNSAVAAAVVSFNGRTGAVSLIANDVSAAGGALLASPTFSGTPSAPTATTGTNTTQLATCAFVQAAISAMTAGVSSFNTRIGAVTLQAADVTGVGGALLAGPAFSGTPTAPTPATTDSSTTLATTAFVHAAITSGTSGYLPLAGGTLTGQLNITFAVGTATFTMNGGPSYGCNLTLNRASATSANNQIISTTNGSTRWTVVVGSGNETGSNAGADLVFMPWTDAGAQIGAALTITRSSRFATFGATVAATGWGTRNGTGGASSGHNFNIDYTTTAQLWMDATNMGTFAFTSDYRTKKDVTPLGGMWERVKRLKPVRYGQKDYTPPHATRPLVVGDDRERWGLVAHELQEALIEDAATGTKDSPDHIQSPNPWTLLAALTKALQEAMTRIETLEAR